MDYQRLLSLVMVTMIAALIAGCESTLNEIVKSTGATINSDVKQKGIVLEVAKSKDAGSFSYGGKAIGQGLFGSSKPDMSGHSDYQIGTVLLTNDDESFSTSFKASPYFLYLVITEVTSNRRQIDSAIASFKENFESYEYLSRLTDDAESTIPFIAPVESDENPLSIENYSVSMARQLQKRYRGTVRDAYATIAIYGSGQELFSTENVAPEEIFVISLEPYTPSEIANVINNVRHKMTISQSRAPMTLFSSARASESAQQRSDGDTESKQTPTPAERLRAMRESEISLIARQIFNAISSWRTGD
ncbi:hypothetical protein J3369_14995 [Alteromonas sp. NFXS44]|uniref:hypothetical protein n=1 Tax=Alteromonas sp. NFXS44 TaxID=2818435 RepID=UPI0032E030C8